MAAVAMAHSCRARAKGLTRSRSKTGWGGLRSVVLCCVCSALKVGRVVDECCWDMQVCGYAGSSSAHVRAATERRLVPRRAARIGAQRSRQEEQRCRHCSVLLPAAQACGASCGRAAFLHACVLPTGMAALCDSCMLLRPCALWHADADEARRAPPHPTTPDNRSLKNCAPFAI